MACLRTGEENAYEATSDHRRIAENRWRGAHAGRVEEEIAAARKARDRITEEFIADGRGQERPSDYRMKTDSLSKRANANDALMSELRFEAEKYVGPGRPAYDLLDSGKLP